MSEQTKTPRTDGALVYIKEGEHAGRFMVPMRISEQLETELAASNKQMQGKCDCFFNEHGLCEKMCAYHSSREHHFKLDIAALQRQADELAAFKRETEVYKDQCGLYLKDNDFLKGRIAELEKELAKWQKPFDQELFDDTKNQATGSGSLAAQGVYIVALEHALKHAERRVRELEKSRAAVIEECAKLFDGFTYGPYAHPSIKIRAMRAIQLEEFRKEMK